MSGVSAFVQHVQKLIMGTDDGIDGFAAEYMVWLLL